MKQYNEFQQLFKTLTEKEPAGKKYQVKISEEMHNAVSEYADRAELRKQEVVEMILQQFFNGRPMAGVLQGILEDEEEE